MNKEFLEDYDERVREEIKELLLKLESSNYKIETGYRYPPPSRLKLNEPYIINIARESLWNQILPNIGTVVIVLYPIKEKNEFEQLHGFKIGDIERLIDFAKDTGRVQFTLGRYPIFYKECNFVEKIFTELQPPMLKRLYPADTLFPIDDNGRRIIGPFPQIDKEIKIWMDEFYYFSLPLLSNKEFVRLLDLIPGVPLEFLTDPEGVVYPSHMSDMIRDYISLRLLGYHKLADEIILNLSTNPVWAKELIHTALDLILHPNASLLGEIDAWSREAFTSKTGLLKHISSKLPPQKIDQTSRNIVFPTEIGKFLNDKLNLIIPENYEGVMKINDIYDEKDLKKLTYSLQKAVENENISGISKNTDEISTILNNSWDDAKKLKKRISHIKHGIEFGFAALLGGVTLPIGGVGLLAGLGLAVAEECAAIKVYGPLSEKLVNWRKPNHLIHVYNFEKKYKLWD